jgi:hypothetical protein
MAQRQRYTPLQLRILKMLTERGPMSCAQMGVSARALWWLRSHGFVKAAGNASGLWEVTDAGREISPKPATWPEGLEEGGYHDISCRCSRHCRNCFEDLDKVRALQIQMIEDQRPGAPAEPLSKRAGYCCGWCQGRAQRDRQLDRHLAQQVPGSRPEGQRASP